MTQQKKESPERRRTRHILIRLAFVLGAILIGLYVMFMIMGHNERKEWRAKGQVMIERIEDFRMNNGRLPESVEEMGLEKEVSIGPFYNKKEDGIYEILFIISSDDTYIYSSDTKKWR